MHGDLGVLSRHDVLLALSYSGETDELLAVLPAARHFEVPIVALTGEPDSSLARWSELTVKVRVPREACPFNLAPTSSTTALLALGDALAVILLERRGFEKSDYARLHPAGAIGRSITLRVTDIMRDGDRFACVTDTMPVREVLVTMTRARSGAVAVVDAQGYLTGIFTDGDFRRHITEDADLLERLVADVMTRNPITIDAGSMAVDLINLLQERRIDDVLVVDADKRPVGVIDIQDLPKFKLM
jgi:arabinose-5-phosphate isomerase